MTAPGPRTSAPTAAQRLGLIQQRWPAAAQLARLLSLAVRIEPSLLRSARLAVGLDAAAEADLWFSSIIASRGSLGISLVPVVAEALRRELAASPGERALAWNLVKEHHGRQPWSIRLEERINYLTTGPSAEASEIEDLLAAALSELHEVRARDEQAALGIARWLLAALARAPATARATPTAAAAELAVGMHLGGRLGGADQLAQAENSELLPWLLDHLGTTVLPVRLLPGAVALGGDPPDAIPLPVPVTDPLVVSVIWGSGAESHHEHIRVTPGEELLVPVEATEVELRTLTGGGVVLRPAGIGRILVNGVDQGAAFAVAYNTIITAQHVLPSWAPYSSPANGPSGSFASEAPASKAEPSEDSDDGSSGSGPVPGVVYVPESGGPVTVKVIASDTVLEVVLLEPERAVPAILPVGQIRPGQQWRLQALPEHDPTDSRQSADVPAASFHGVMTAGDPRPKFMLTESTGSLRGQIGAAITLENPWGAVIGLLLAETAELPRATVEQGRTEEATTPGRPRGSLRVAPIDAIVASFNLARQITPATASLVDGKWPETQPLEDLVALPLRNGVLPVLADIEPTQLGFSPGPSAHTITPTLQSALAASAFLLFAGAARALSWEAYRAVRAELPNARLLVPNTKPGTLMALTTHPDLAAYPERVVVWLDDLPRYLSESGGLDSLILSRFEEQHHQTVLIGTISEADLDRLLSDARQPGPIQHLLDLATVISLEVAVEHRPPAGPVARRPLSEMRDPFVLEVHRPVQPEDAPPGLPLLPPYVPREHDEVLGSVVRAAAGGRSGIAVLVGGPSTGKTRACWEALALLRDLDPPWRLWHPIDPTRPEAALRELPAIGPRTVVWLNEAQLYLDAADGGLGERVAAGLRELLRDPARAPVLVLATLWPQFWDALTTHPTGGAGPHAQARELLAGHDITVPAAYTPEHMTDRDATEQRITELYTKAVEQLGNDKAPVQLSGLYSLERLAQDNPAQRQTIVNVICAYLRMPFSPTSASKPEATEAQEAPAAETETSTEALGDTRQQERQVRLTAQRILAEHLRDDRAEDKRSSGPPSPRFWPDIRLDLTGATLIDFSIQSAVVADAAFGGATFSGDAGFDRATFSGDARFGEATFSGDAGFDGATFSSAAWFDGATFSGDARFGEATFSLDARFDGATFSSDARFDRATFGGVAMFREVAFSSDAWFGEAAFSSDAVFVRADFSGDARFDGATFSGGEACLFFDQSGVALPDAQHVWPTGRWLGPDGKGGYTVVRSEV